MPGDLSLPKHGPKMTVLERLQNASPRDVAMEGVKTPKRQHSSRFDISDQRTLQKLPSFHGLQFLIGFLID